jgi:hypothetical protein
MWNRMVIASGVVSHTSTVFQSIQTTIRLTRR